MSDVRASDAEREATVERLRDAAAEGRLTLEELADRIEVAGDAVTRGELTTLLSDLPTALPVERADVAPVRAMGDVKRSGAWVVPAESRYVPGAPRIVLTGGTVFGDLKVRHRRLWEKLVRLAR